MIKIVPSLRHVVGVLVGAIYTCLDYIFAAALGLRCVVLLITQMRERRQGAVSRAGTPDPNPDHCALQPGQADVPETEAAGFSETP